MMAYFKDQTEFSGSLQIIEVTLGFPGNFYEINNILVVFKSPRGLSNQTKIGRIIII